MLNDPLLFLSGNRFVPKFLGKSAINSRQIERDRRGDCLLKLRVSTSIEFSEVSSSQATAVFGPKLVLSSSPIVTARNSLGPFCLAWNYKAAHHIAYGWLR